MNDLSRIDQFDNPNDPDCPCLTKAEEIAEDAERQATLDHIVSRCEWGEEPDCVEFAEDEIVLLKALYRALTNRDDRQPDYGAECIDRIANMRAAFAPVYKRFAIEAAKDEELH